MTILPHRGLHRFTAAALALVFALSPLSAVAQQAAASYTFRVNSDLVLVNIVARDKSGNLVRDLKRDDFTVQEDGKAQQIQSFDLLTPDAAPPADALVQTATTTKTQAGPRIVAPGNAPNELIRDKRLIVLFFDLSAMEPEEVDRAVKSARDYVDKQMSSADLVGVVTLGDSMQVAQEFTDNRDALRTVIARIGGTEGEGFQAEDTTSETGAQYTPDDSEYNIFNSDRRLQAITALSQSLSRFQQKKSILYFSGGMERTGTENQSQLRTAINTAVRSNVSLYAVDSRGLQALPPGGDSSRASLRGVSAYSGAAVQSDLDSNFSSQETLVTLASDTGGKAFLDSNDFSPAFKRIQADTSSYYLLGYRSTNKNMDGRYRRITIKINRKDLKLEYRPGYYGPRDFAHSSKEDRETELEEEMMAELPRTDLPVYLETAFFRMQNDRYYVPVSIVVPGSAIPVRGNATDKTTAVLDILGLVREAGTKFPVGNVRDTVKIGVDAGSGTARKNVQYSTGFNLPPGKYSLKFVIRDNQDGRIGTFETTLTVPDLKKSPLKMSSIILSSQAGPAGKEKKSPLVRNGAEILPNLAHVFSNGQKMTVFFEVYEPAKMKSPDGKNGNAVRVLTALQFFSGRVKVFETPVVEAGVITTPERKAASFQLDVPLQDLKPGWYTCQLSVIDDASGAFAFPRFAVRVDERRN
ncbi:MAG TPA: VWA domain-containing protein [Terriglobales bacterium]|nr:VWA domain-containing protein [Terriglobales bacterium]